MNGKEVNRRVKNAFTNATPDVLSSILQDSEQQKGAVIPMTNTTNRKPRPIARILAVAAAVAILLGGAAAAAVYAVNHRIDTTISLDVNPSVEIRIDRKERVREVEALNEDGRTIIGEMDFEGSDLDVTVNALIGSMLRNGYITDLANSILVSVDSKDTARSAALQKRLSDEIATLLKTESFNGAVLSQAVTHDDELDKLAVDNNITAGKAQLIREIVANNSLYTFEDMVPLSINELNLLAKTDKQHLDKVQAVGTASDKAYIGRDKAIAAAFAHAGVPVDADLSASCELDYDDGVMIYEVEFTYDRTEYDYDIHALDGTVVKVDKDVDEDDRYDDNDDRNEYPRTTTAGTQAASGTKPASTAKPTSALIGRDAAKAAALKHAGVSADAIRDYECELDEENGVRAYEIEFSSGSYDYEYAVNATTGAIIKSDKELDD